MESACEGLASMRIAYRDFSASVPNEVLRLVFFELFSSSGSKKSLTNARLVDKRWSAVAATVLWYHLDVTLDDSAKFDALLKSSPNGVLDNVRELSITSDPSGPRSFEQKQQTGTNLLKLFSVLPRDCLWAFHNKNFLMEPISVCLLLRCQSKLRTLDVRVSHLSHDSFPSPCYVRGNLQDLETLDLDVLMSFHSTYEGVGDWFAHMPKLKSMKIGGRFNGTNSFNGWELSGPSKFLKLSNITMENVTLPDDATRITGHLQLPFLRGLSFRFCTNTVPFIRSLIRSYKQTRDVTSLQTYQAYDLSTNRDCQQASADLIKICTRLKMVCVAYMTDCLLDVGVLGLSCKTIFGLSLSTNGRPTNYYTPDDFSRLVNLCPNIRNLSTCLGDLTPIVDGLRFADPVRLSNIACYIEKLRMIARLKNLRRLHIMDSPLMSGNWSANERRMRYNEIATQILKVLAHFGSPVQQLRYNPIREPEPVEVDADGQEWPNYSYIRGTITVCRGLVASRTIVAVPDPGHFDKR
ncbi:hypothetical protein E8E13_006784 [Curvularia kusanoi]|uniref:F-box domain-containing protein n=1 Tax=Curvularia kusanoi TaxID=90978 RepID=A0A9P4WBL4_CURKU|nr:hypothetical protein E8E13_006784 [Curvularia kusanoi]